MRHTFLFLFLLFFAGWATAQTDTTIYQVVEEMPRFPACEQLDTTITAKQECANRAMLQYVYSQVVYPQEAINEGLEGTAVINFVVETDGRITQPQIVRDPGGGIGLAALAVVLRMREDDIRWVPGKQKGQTVRVQFNLPVRFKLEDPDPFVLVGKDTVYTDFETALDYKGGVDALQTYLSESLNYPAAGLDSCLMGQIDIQVLIEGDGNVRVLDLTDYNDLGFDFWYAAIDVATSTYGQWTPARYDDRPVNAAFDLSLSFMPPNDGCASEVERFARARELADEGATLFNEEQFEAGIVKMTEAVDAFPNDAQLRILRGQAFLNNNQLSEACADLSQARRIALIDWYDNILPIICR